MRRNLHAGGAANRGLSLSVFTAEELDDIHSATLEVLQHSRPLRRGRGGPRRLRAGGCTVDRQEKSVRIPPCVVEEAIRSAPSTIRLCGRDPRTTSCSPTAASASPTSARRSWSSTRRRGEVREPTKADVGDIVTGHRRTAGDRRLRATGRRPRGAAGAGAAAQRRGDVHQHVEAPLHRPHQRLPAAAHHGDGRCRRRRPGGAPCPPAGQLPDLPGQPPEAGPRHLRDHHGRRPRRGVRRGALDGHGRRLLAGHAGRHPRHPQRRGPGRHRPLAADRPRGAGDLRLLDDRHGPAPGGGLGRQSRSAA